jgi:hypothetical protein
MMLILKGKICARRIFRNGLVTDNYLILTMPLYPKSKLSPASEMNCEHRPQSKKASQCNLITFGNSPV